MNKSKTEKHLVEVIKTARYFTYGELTGKTKNIWFVLHGYGQLAKYFIGKFEILNDGNNFIVSPEALNKFYLKGFSGRIGATWMTKEERESEIKDYVNFLDSVYTTLLNNINLNSIKINLLGFSQGAHTAVRWLLKGKIKPDNLILWSGSFPNEPIAEDEVSLLNESNMFILIGSRDEFIDEKSIEAEKRRLNSMKLNYELIQFEGGHEITGEVLSLLVKRLEAKDNERSKI